MLLDTKYEIELVELNGEKAEYLDENSVIKIKNFGAFNNQFAEIHFIVNLLFQFQKIMLFFKQMIYFL